MNILIDTLPESVVLDNKQYSINADFKTALKILCKLEEKGLYVDKLTFVLKSFYNELPLTLENALKGLKSFYGISQKGVGEGDAIFSFEKDSEYIYSAFYSFYNIDLCRENMHWYSFLALFKGLCGENVFSKVLSIRSINPSEIKDSALKQKYIKLKEKYSLNAPLSIEDGLGRLF